MNPTAALTRPGVTSRDGLDQQAAARPSTLPRNLAAFPRGSNRRDHAGMTKAENRAAAKAYQQEKLQRWRQQKTPLPIVWEQLFAVAKYPISEQPDPLPHSDIASS
jgi:hypothetical protein